MGAWTQGDHCLPLPPPPGEVAGKSKGGGGEILFSFEKIVVFDHPILLSSKAGTTWIFPKFGKL